MRICSKCQSSKIENEDNFRLCKYKNGTTYYYSICKECAKLKNLEYAQNHKEKRKAYQKNYTIANPEYNKNWRLTNKDRLRKRERERHSTDINFKLKKNVSRAIGHAIVKNRLSTFKHLPYTVQELKEHIEKQFDLKMSWDNYGNYWHIDHIVPHNLFKYTFMKEQSFQDCWALNNLRPLEKHQNMLDGATKVRHK